MPDIFQEDFRDFLKALNDQDVKYIMGCKLRITTASS